MTARGWRRGKLGTVLGSSVCICIALFQPAVARAGRFGLEQLIRMALERSPELKKAHQDIAAALSDLDQAKAAHWAQIDVVGMGGLIDDAKAPIVKVSPTPGPDGFLSGRIEANDK